MASNPTYKKLLDEHTSFSLVRTSPLLTGNVKLTVSSDNNLFLNSIDANEELSKEEYKSIPIDINYAHTINIKKFFKNGKTPSNIVFDLKTEVDPTKPSLKYEDQYDFSLYYAGVNYLTSKTRDEKLSYFAPLYLKDILPEYFVIFRIKDPMNYKIDESKQKFPFIQKDYIYDLFKNASIIKTFDLTENTKIGKYIKKYISDPLFPSSPLTINFEEDLLSTWNGISVQSGMFTSKGEFLNSFFKTEYPLKKVEDYITTGYHRNNIIFPNILNLEFLFDETDEVEKYDMNRYIGLYINKIDLGKFTLDIDSQYRLNGEYNNTPFYLKKKWTEIDDVVENIGNTNGVNIFYKNESNLLFNKELDKDKLYFNYIEDKLGNLYLPHTTDAIDETKNRITLSNTKINLGNLFGTKDDFIKDSGSVPTEKGYSNAYIKIKGEFEHLDKIIIYSAFGSKLDIDGNKYDEFVALDHTINNEVVPNFIPINSPGDFYINYSDTEDVYYFSAKTTQNNFSVITAAIYELFKGVNHRNFEVFSQNDTIILKLRTAGNFNDTIQFKYVPYNTNYSSIEINGYSGTQLQNTDILLQGGNTLSENRLVLDSKYKDKILQNINDICVRTQNGYSYIEGVSYYIDTINEVNTDTEELRVENFSKYFSNIVLTLKDKEKPSVKTNQFIIKNRFNSKFGLLSIFPIKDFNYDFYSSNYNKSPLWEYYKYYFIPEKKDLIEAGIVYKVKGTGTISYNSVIYAIDDIFTGISSINSYTINTGSPIVIYNDDLTDDEDNELKAFIGFSILKDPVLAKPSEETELWERRDRFINGAINTEYDYYKENYVKDFALTSKLLPYIAKWGYKGGKDIRDNEYRLNTNVQFGINNFSSNHNDTTQNPENFTHEWPYLEASYDFIKDKDILKKNYSYFNTEFDLNECLTNSDYFIDYFNFKNELDGEELDNLQSRYSFIKYNNDKNLCETFFKGTKLIFKEVLNKDIVGEDKKPIYKTGSKKYDGYKFSVLLKPIKEDINDNKQPPIRFRFIEHEDYKFILFLIEVSVGYFDNNTDGDYRINFTNNISDFSYNLLYSLKHKKSILPDLSNGYGIYPSISSPVSNHRYSNIKLSFYVGLDSNNTIDISAINNTTLRQYTKIANPNISTYDSNPVDEIHSFLKTFQVDSDNYDGSPYPSVYEPYGTLIFRNNTTSTEFDIIRFNSIEGAPSSYPNPTGFPAGTTYSISPISGVSPSGIIMQTIIESGRNERLILEQISHILPSLLPLYYVQDNVIFKQKNGGLQYYESLFKKLSFAKIKDYINRYQPIIEYHTVNSTSNIDESNPTKNSSKNNFYIEILNSSIIKKETLLGYSADDNKPDAVKTSDLIGFEYHQFPIKNNVEVFRYNGGYEPIFNDILKFKDNLDFKWQDDPNIKINFANLVLNNSHSDFGIIKNFNYLKVIENNIMLLDQGNLVYPLIDEVSISQKDLQIFSSNWDWGFHQKNISKIESTPVAGSFRVSEDNSFMNKVLNVPFAIELNNYELFNIGNSELKDINIDNYQIVIKETADNISGLINIKNVLLKYLIDDGADTKFKEFLIDDSQYLNKLNLDQYIQSYLETNILRLYTIDKTEFYIQRTKESNEITFNFIDDETRNSEGYSLLKDISIQKLDNLVIQFTLRKESNNGFKISPSIKIKLI